MIQKEYEAKMREILDREVNTDEDCISTGGGTYDARCAISVEQYLMKR